MSSINLILVLLAVSAVAYVLSRKRAVAVVGGVQNIRNLHSLPSYYGAHTALWMIIPVLLMMMVWGMSQSSVIEKQLVSQLPAKYQEMEPDKLGLVLNEISNIATGGIIDDNPTPEYASAAAESNRLYKRSKLYRTLLACVLAFAGFLISWRLIHPDFRARNRVESITKGVLLACSMVAILTTLGILLSVIFEAIRFFQMVPVSEFLLGLKWSPQLAIRADQVGSSGSFGAIPLFTGTLLIAFIAMIVATPVGLMTAIYLSEYASKRFRAFAKPALEVLAGIPTVVYGFFAVVTVGPLISDTAALAGLDVTQGAALGVGLVMGIMIIPFVSSLSDDVINAVPQAMRDGSYGLGATQSETIKRVVLPAALPGIVGGILLAMSRAIGETMIVVMAAGLSAKLTANPLESVTTVTAQIVSLLVGDQEFDSPKTLAAFALGLVLFIVTLILNVIALRVVRRYREQYA
ncbi:MAG: phosphate ABC transporter permease subunit PstC [Gammaproteobacteria bacterium]